MLTIGGNSATEKPPAASALESAHPAVEEPKLLRRIAALRVDRYSGLLMIGALIVVYSIWLPNVFPTTSTLDSVLSTQAVTGVVALAVLFPLAAGVFDLSIAQNVTTSSLVCAALMTRGPHFSPAFAIVVTLAVGGLIGAVNGFLVAVVRLNSFIATLGTTSLLTAVSSLIANGNLLGPFSASFEGLTSQTVLGVPIVAVYLLVAAIIAWYALEHTPMGRRIYAVGLSPESARLAGIRTTRILFTQFVVCGVVTAAAAVLLTSTINSSSETVGAPYLLPAYAAAFLGSTQLKPGRFNVWGMIIAIYLLGVGITGLQLAGLNIWVTYLFNGFALLVAVGVSTTAARRAASGKATFRRRNITKSQVAAKQANPESEA